MQGQEERPRNHCMGMCKVLRNTVALLAQSQSIQRNDLCSIMMQIGFWGKLPTGLQNVLGRERLQSLVRTLCVVVFSAGWPRYATKLSQVPVTDKEHCVRH